MFTRTLLATAFAVTAFALPAAAGEESAPRRVANSAEVTFGDLDLATANGEAELHGRVKAAIRQVCGTANVRDLKASRDVRQCREQAMADATPRLEVALAAARKGEQLADATLPILGR